MNLNARNLLTHTSESWDKYEDIFDAIREPFLVLSGDLRVVKANKAFYSFFRVEPADTVQKFIYDIGDREWNIPTLRHLLEEILPQEQSLDSYEISHRFDAIGERTLLLNARSVSHSGLILLAIEDVTERVRYQKELERSNQALSTVAAIASHDLREPLTTVSSFLQLIESELQTDKDAKVLEYLRFAKDCTGRMTDLVERLYEHASLGGKKLQAPVDLNLICLQVIGDLKERILASGAKIHKTLLPVVCGDSSQLSQLFQNLLNNAIKYKRAVPPQISIGAKRDDQGWIIFIKDNGMGIPMQDVEKIFKIFTRLHSKEISGSGIGLATCKKIIENHGGEIWVESVLGEGSTFYFRLHNECR